MTDETDTPPLDRQQLTDARLDRLEHYTRDLGVWALGERARIWFPPLDDDAPPAIPSVSQLAAMSRAEGRQDAMREIAMGANLSDKTLRNAEAAFLESAVASAIAQSLCASGALKHADDPASPWALGPCLLAAKAALVAVKTTQATRPQPTTSESSHTQPPATTEPSWRGILRKAAVIGLFWGFSLVGWRAAWTALGEVVGWRPGDTQLLSLFVLMLLAPFMWAVIERVKRWRIVRWRLPLVRSLDQADEGNAQ